MRLSKYEKCPQLWAGLGRAVNNLCAFWMGPMSVALLRSDREVLRTGTLLVLLVLISLAFFFYTNAAEMGNAPGESRENVREPARDEVRRMEAFAEDFSLTEREKEVRMKLLDRCCSMENDYLREHGGVLYPKLEETLSALKEKYPLYIVSNCQSGYIEAFLDHYGFGKYFEDIECYGNNLKQKGDNIRLLADRNGLTEAVYVGDIQGDYDASCHAGVGFIHAAYGFGTIAADVPEIHTFEELTETADQYFALR
mgnify:CR=1 FL=1